ncbi:MAG: hypothetical protein KIS87_05190 [Phycisphaeraceae bacterium]|nr:hypothetical protein [Phycisphaeraceae bacterium]
MPMEAIQRSLLESVAERASRAGVFGPITLNDAVLACQALDAAASAEYRVGWDGGRVWVSLVTPNRWLSESIEADLMHTGDDIDELLEEELVEQGLEPARPIVEHFRSDDRLFTFRSPVPKEDSETVARWLLAYEACFRALGDMAGGTDEEES